VRQIRNPRLPRWGCGQAKSEIRNWAGAICIVALAFGLLAPLAVKAQQAGKPFRVGVLYVPTAGEAVTLIGRLGELGYVEGRDCSIEYRYADGSYDRLPELAADLVRARLMPRARH